MTKKTDNTTEQKNVVIVSTSVPKKDLKWYVVHTYSGQEIKVSKLIKQRTEALGHTDKIAQVMIPQQEKIVISEGKKRKVNERLFPGYVLVQMILSDDSWSVVRGTSGVTGFVGTGSNPTPLPQKEVDALVKFMHAEQPKFEARFQVGDSIKINEGPFADFIGKIDEVNEDQGKLKVLVSVFGRETPVELDFMQVKSI